eukprot:202997-Prorocentrum_minimum.AAC.1
MIASRCVLADSGVLAVQLCSSRQIALTNCVEFSRRLRFVRWLRERGVHVSVRAGAVRVSIGVYITAAMVDRFCALM